MENSVRNLAQKKHLLRMKNKRRNETIAAKVLSRFDSGSGNQEVSCDDDD